MEKVDRLLSFLSYSRRIVLQLLDVKNLKYSHLIFKGFTPDKGYIYNFKKYGYQSYVTDANRYLKSIFINYNNRDLLDDKYGCYLFLRQYTKKVIPVCGLIDNGQFYLLNPYTEISELLAAGKKFILKPRKGRGGAGVMLFEILNGEFYLNGRQISTFEDVFKGLKNYILTPYVEQHKYSAAIYPKSLNSIRLLTCIQDGKARIIGSGHRFGGENTGCVDNFSAGGISATVNLATGVLEEPNIWDEKRRKLQIVEHHPSTGQRISGVKIPFWSKMTREMIQLHESIKFIKYVGWDIAITPNNYKIIEANYASDLEGLQLKNPLLTDEANKKFFSMYA